MLKETVNPGNPTGTNQYEEKLPDVTNAPKLSEIGISKRDSSNWQRIADIPEESFYLISYQMCYVMQITIPLVMWPMLNL